MLLLRMVVPGDLASRALGYLEVADEVVDVVHLPGASRRPPGDLVECLISPDAASVVVSGLRELGVAERGSISLTRVDAAVAEHAPDTDADAVVWEEVEQRMESAAQLSTSFLVYMMAATMIAAIGILTDSLVLIVGAMVVGPEFGPLAALCVGLIQRRGDLVRQAGMTLIAGFVLAGVAAYLATLGFDAAGIAPAVLDAEHHPATLFISRPDAYAVVIAALAGVAGMMSLTTASVGTLIGVLISVTTIPAAGNVGVALAYGNVDDARGAMLQLVINVAVLILAGLATLKLQRNVFARRLAAAVERLNRRRRGSRGSRGGDAARPGPPARS
jgi:uncharacterized hydrophobic protein (TIGR00271 family)